MSLKWQLSNLELSRKLKILGIKQQSAFYYIHSSSLGKKWRIAAAGTFVKNYHEEHIAAFTVAELGKLLPDGFATYRTPDGKWRLGWNPTLTLSLKEFKSGCDTEANARSTMLIYLVREGIVKCEEVNQSL